MHRLEQSSVLDFEASHSLWVTSIFWRLAFKKLFLRSGFFFGWIVVWNSALGFINFKGLRMFCFFWSSTSWLLWVEKKTILLHCYFFWVIDFLFFPPPKSSISSSFPYWLMHWFGPPLSCGFPVAFFASHSKYHSWAYY